MSPREFPNNLGGRIQMMNYAELYEKKDNIIGEAL